MDDRPDQTRRPALTNSGKISVRSLSKAFDLQKRRKGRTGVSSREIAAVWQLVRSVFSRGIDESRRFYAVRNLSLDVESGEIMGIIGRNGAGKSTLLKILARVLDPTEGSVRMEGRVASLLELGAGFAGDMTVAENISLQVSLTGGKEDPELEQEILELADLVEYRDKELDECPGVAAVRLSFATLITLASEVVLADEMLAVGDLRFKQMVIDRIKKVRDEGGCVLFVSHDLNAIKELCDRVMWIERGQSRMVGSAEEVVKAYEDDIHARTKSLESKGADDAGQIVDLRLVTGRGRQVGAMELHRTTYLECIFQHLIPDRAMRLRFEINNGRKQVIYSSSQLIEAVPDGAPGAFRARVKIPGHFLNQGPHHGKAVLKWETLKGRRKEVQMKTEFMAANSAEDKSVWGDWDGERKGLIAPQFRWSFTTSQRRGGRKQRRQDEQQ